MRAVNRIQVLLCELPKSDIPLAQSFLDARDFECLKEIVDSAIIKIRKSRLSLTPREEYEQLDLDNLSRLKSEVDVYLEQLTLPTNVDNYDEYEEEFI